MKIFDQAPPRPTKVNFADENNVILGYDMEQDCCEEAGWFIDSLPHATLPDEPPKQTPDVSGYRFDTSFFSEVADAKTLDQGGMAIFRIVNSSGDRLYIHLYNAHNGYYCHGFTFEGPDGMIKDDDV